MLRVIIKPNAGKAIGAVAFYIESKNLPGSADNWINEIIDFVISHARPNSKYSLCKNKSLAAKGYSCITFQKKWVIAFTKSNNALTVHQIIFGAKLK